MPGARIAATSFIAWALLAGPGQAVATHAVIANGATQKARRTFLRAEWRTRVLVGSTLDSDLLNPDLLETRGTTYYLYDYGDHRVKAFNSDGTLRWQFGRDGRGPNEFVNPTDLKVDANGFVWLVDPQNARVTIVAPDGRSARSFPTESLAERLMPLGDLTCLIFGFSQDSHDIVRVDSLGRRLARLAKPAWMDSAPSLVSELRVSVRRDGQFGVIASRYSGRLLAVRAGASALRDLPAIETQPFPAPVSYTPRAGLVVRRFPPDARPLVRAITSDEANVYVLIGGVHRERGRIVDIYATPSGAYRGSYLLPEAVSGISARRNGFAALMTDSVPALVLIERVK